MLTVGSLFSGIGGFDLGFERAGMDVRWQCEIDKAAREVLRRHWPDAMVYEDVRNVGSGAAAVDVVCGGFPCQDVSVAGRRAGLAGERSGLWFEFARVLSDVKPEWVVVENVPGLLTSNRGRDFGTILAGLVQRGYCCAWRVLDSQYFGVPQRRRRLYIVGHLGDGRAAHVLFERTGNQRNPPQADGEEEGVPDYPPLAPAWWNGSRVSQTLDAVLYKKQAMPEKNRFPAVVVPAWTECPDCGDFWCNLHGEHAYDCPCPPVDDWAEFDLSPYDPSVLRYITPTEAARLQGFPDDWNAWLSDAARYRQYGNAVTVNVAEWIGRRIVEATHENTN
jgi:DNA (cytosine-5)-methyltransferase 1